MSRSALLARPVSGTAWTNKMDVAQLSLGTANVCDSIFDRISRTHATPSSFGRSAPTVTPPSQWTTWIS